MLFFIKLALVLTFTGEKVLAGDYKEVAKTCALVLDYQKYIKCCDKMDTVHMDEMEKEIKEKCPKEDEEWTCEYAECVLTSTKMMKDGKIDYKTVKENNDIFVKNYPWANETAAAVLEGCSEKNINRISGDMCLPMKWQMCTLMMSVLSCPVWKTDSDCEKMPDTVAKCQEAISKLQED